jgi:hypothetical protein
MKALFTYDPKEDSLHPCPEIGLMFFQGDILAIVNQANIVPPTHSETFINFFRNFLSSSHQIYLSKERDYAPCSREKPVMEFLNAIFSRGFWT